MLLMDVLQGHASQHISAARLLLFTPPYLSLRFRAWRHYSDMQRRWSRSLSFSRCSSVLETSAIAYRGHLSATFLGGVSGLRSKVLDSLATPRWCRVCRVCPASSNPGAREFDIFSHLCLIFLLMVCGQKRHSETASGLRGQHGIPTGFVSSSGILPSIVSNFAAMSIEDRHQLVCWTLSPSCLRSKE
ncbi:uncharacterized protein LY89DRAFT_691212 [Mollisia scopiformis]|uniref:Uncharacterized protein n=1 Tax=Mollisia scopiformis TaxID=149040 RepID=A0A132B7H9_MOLSC|nr:uncharacterized protein LY89DRAFT_691212 [Mollisia scopiformis]KUJ08365.1 hypothetical protein LY89DRAFT_691212 [Mollisia scopiformis]